MSVAKLAIHVDGLSLVLQQFDRIQVWRSPDKSGSPTAYVEVTSEDETAATIVGTAAGPWALNGLALTITQNGGTPFTVTFSGTNPLALRAVLAQLNAARDGLAVESGTNTNKISLSSPTKGTGSSLLISGTAAAVLGLTTAKVNGKAARIPFAPSSEDYTFYDLDGDASYWYKTRYYSTLTGTVSGFSEPREGSPSTVTPSASRVLATINLTDGAGRPIVGRRVVLVPTTPISLVGTSGATFASLPGFDRIEIKTDEAGHGELSLLIGQTFMVFIEGTPFQREFMVPNVDFDIFTVAALGPDAFSIVQAPPSPIRMS